MMVCDVKNDGAVIQRQRTSTYGNEHTIRQGSVKVHEAKMSADRNKVQWVCIIATENKVVTIFAAPSNSMWVVWCAGM